MRAFYYVDGIPTRGIWIDIDSTTTTGTVLKELTKAGVPRLSAAGVPKYGGDLLVADIEGDLVRAFYHSQIDMLDLPALVEVIEYCERNHVDPDAAAAYVSDRGSWSASDFQDSYRGKADSELAYAEQLFDELYLHEVPERVRAYISYEKFARDLFISDCVYLNGHVFSR